jgi:hypothetical protein
LTGQAALNKPALTRSDDVVSTNSIDGQHLETSQRAFEVAMTGACSIVDVRITETWKGGHSIRSQMRSSCSTSTHVGQARKQGGQPAIGCAARAWDIKPPPEETKSLIAEALLVNAVPSSDVKSLAAPVPASQITSGLTVPEAKSEKKLLMFVDVLKKEIDSPKTSATDSMAPPAFPAGKTPLVLAEPRAAIPTEKGPERVTLDNKLLIAFSM